MHMNAITQDRTDQLFKNLFDAAPDAMIITGENGLIQMVNRLAEKLFGYSRDEMVGQPIEFIMPERFTGPHAVNNLRARPIDDTDEWLALKKDGSSFYVEVNFSSIETPGGTLVTAILRDVSERKLTDDRLRQSNKSLELEVTRNIDEIARNERRFRRMIENSNDVVLLFDADYQPIYYSQNFKRITGWTMEELKGKTPDFFINAADLPMLLNIKQKVTQFPGRSFFARFRFNHKNDHEIWIEGSSTSFLHDEDLQAIIVNLRDVSDKKSAEVKLADSRLIYQTIAANIPDALIVMFDAEYYYILIEGALIHQIGYSKDQLLNRPAKEALPSDVYEPLRGRLDRVFRGESFSVEAEINGLDILSRYVPIRNESNEVTLAMVVAINVTELKNTQRSLAALNQELEQKVIARTQQLEMVNKELEAFTYSVSHDLRAPLRIIDGFSNILLEEYKGKLDEDGIRTLDVVKSNAQRMGQLIDDLLNLSRLGRKELVFTQVDMDKLVDVILEETQLVKNSTVTLERQPLQSAYCDLRLIKQVWINLISNAVKYSGKVEHPAVTIGCKEEAQAITYYIKDNGVGFDMRYADKLFGVFQRLHKQNEFEGTGVGLALVQRIVIMHGGKVWAESEPGKGATFYFSIPVLIPSREG